MKAKFLLFGLVFSILLAIPLILAYNYNIDVDSNYSVFNIEVYKCNDDSCSVITFHDSSTSGEYSLVGSGDNYYAEYDYKSCFRPHIYRMHVWGDLSGDEDYDILFDKKEDCEADINDGDLSEYEIDLGESVLITSNIHSGFEYPNGIPETTAIPIGIEDEYSTNTKVSFYANDIKIYETDKEILLASDEDFEFDWTPTSAGVYEIKVKSEVIDCACSSENTQTEIIGELIVNEPAECSIDSDCADDYYEDNYCFEDDSYRYFHDFSCVNESCFEDIINELVEECDYDCVDGECIDEPPECCDDDDCSDDYYGDNYCVDDDVYRKFYDYGCEDGECEKDTTTELVEECAYSCDDGECEDEPDDDDNTWCIETNLCEVEFDQSDVMPIMLSDDGNGQSYSMMLTRDGGEGEEDKEDGKSNDYFWIIALIIAIIIILIIIILLQVI